MKLNAGLVKVCPQRLPLTLDPLKVALGAQNQVVARMSAEGWSTMLGHQLKGSGPEGGAKGGGRRQEREQVCASST